MYTFLNEEFLNMYEELSELNEAKADTQKLIDFAGEELANRFLAIRSRLKAPENDLYYWIKNHTPEQLLKAIEDVENTKSNRQKSKEIADQGAELICETDHWKVYHITTFEASQKYGRDSKWCITGVDNYGDKYWKQYTEQGVKFYFLVTKGEYDPRGRESKFAVAVFKDGNCEIYDQRDDRVSGDEIPNIEGIQIPGIHLEDVKNMVGYCDSCDYIFYDENEMNFGPRGEFLCDDCFNEQCFICQDCNETFWQSEAYLSVNDEYVCERCFVESDAAMCDGCGGVYTMGELSLTSDGEFYCEDCLEEENSAS